MFSSICANTSGFIVVLILVLVINDVEHLSCAHLFCISLRLLALRDFTTDLYLLLFFFLIEDEQNCFFSESSSCSFFFLRKWCVLRKGAVIDTVLRVGIDFSR